MVAAIFLKRKESKVAVCSKIAVSESADIATLKEANRIITVY